MTEHSKIPLDNANPAGKDGGSLFERASGAFQFDALRPIAPPRNLPPANNSAPAVSTAAPTHPAPAASVDPAQQVARPVPAQQVRVPLSGGQVSIDREHLRKEGLIVPDGSITALLEEFRIVKREILGDAREGGTDVARRILVCSPHSGEGKTYCATNLAIAMAAERDIEVVLVDADIHKPSIPRVLGFEAGLGFMDTLADPSIAPEHLVLQTDIDGLFVMPAGSRNGMAAEYLASDRTKEVLDRLTVSAPNRVLIFDTPPALAASPAAELAKHVGQALLVARADSTGQSALEDARNLLSACADIKLLLNDTHFSPSGRSFGTYEAMGS